MSIGRRRAAAAAGTILFVMTARATVSYCAADNGDSETGFSEQMAGDPHRAEDRLFHHFAAVTTGDNDESLRTSRPRIGDVSNLFERGNEKTKREQLPSMDIYLKLTPPPNVPTEPPEAATVIRDSPANLKEGRYVYEPLIQFTRQTSPPTKEPTPFPTNASPSPAHAPITTPPTTAPPNLSLPTEAPTIAQRTEPPTKAPHTTGPIETPSASSPTPTPVQQSQEPPTQSPTPQPSPVPTRIPPSASPMSPATPIPTRSPQPPSTQRPTPQPSPKPTQTSPSASPISPATPIPTKALEPPPTQRPTAQPSPRPTDSPSADEKDPKLDDVLSFRPGNFSDGRRSSDNRIILSNGLFARPVAQAGQRVQLADGTESELKFHKLPDGAAVFPSKTDNGWLYVSNAENDKSGTEYNHGGVGVLKFNAKGEVTEYYKIADNTKRNCGGGATPWNSWVTCEEVRGGRIHQTDPYGVKTQEVTAMGDLGYYESFAYDVGTGTVKPTFYATRDRKDGVVTRFTPDDEAMDCYNKPDDYDRWCTLDSGSIHYLFLAGGSSGGTVEWTSDEEKAAENAEGLYPSSEGIDIQNGILYFTSKEDKRLVIVDLRKQTYTTSSTRSGAFNNQPDQIDKVLGTNSKMLLLCEDGGKDAGLHGRNSLGDYFTILYRDEKVDSDGKHEETTGLGVSPDFKHLYISFQHEGIIYDVTRDDDYPLNGQLLDIKYHAMES